MDRAGAAHPSDAANRCPIERIGLIGPIGLIDEIEEIARGGLGVRGRSRVRVGRCGRAPCMRTARHMKTPASLRRGARVFSEKKPEGNSGKRGRRGEEFYSVAGNPLAICLALNLARTRAPDDRGPLRIPGIARCARMKRCNRVAKSRDNLGGSYAAASLQFRKVPFGETSVVRMNSGSVRVPVGGRDVDLDG
jgi:hypothetical protein